MSVSIRTKQDWNLIVSKMHGVLLQSVTHIVASFWKVENEDKRQRADMNPENRKSARKLLTDLTMTFLCLHAWFYSRKHVHILMYEILPQRELKWLKHLASIDQVLWRKKLRKFLKESSDIFFHTFILCLGYNNSIPTKFGMIIQSEYSHNNRLVGGVIMWVAPPTNL